LDHCDGILRRTVPSDASLKRSTAGLALRSVATKRVSLPLLRITQPKAMAQAASTTMPIKAMRSHFE
jgi:hypothetical protein